MNGLDKPQKKLNIAMVCDQITDYIAGVFKSTTRFSENLRDRGHKIIFIAAKSPFSQENNCHSGMKVYRFRSVLLPKTESRFRLALPTVAEVKEVLKKENINIAHILLPTPLAFIAAKAAKVLGIKIIMHSHSQPENLFLHIPKFAGREIMNNLYKKYLVNLYMRADALVYPSGFAQKFFPTLNAKIYNKVISNGVDTSVFKKMDAEKLFVKWNLPRETKNILFVGRLHPEKNIEILIKSAPLILKKYPQTHFYIVGPGHQKDWLKSLAKKLKLEKNLTFFGKVTDEELVMSYNASDIFVLPSLAELEGMVVLEAMACGLPIIIADSENNAAKHFVDNNGFLFRSGNPIDLAEKIIAILADNSLREQMGSESLKISKQFEINQSVLKMENLYYFALSQ